jgi:hypothetical protein
MLMGHRASNNERSFYFFMISYLYGSTDIHDHSEPVQIWHA